MQEEERITLREAADALGISEVTARRWVKSGKLRAYQPGRKYLVPATAVQELLTRSDEYPPVLDLSNEDFKELVEGLDYDQAGDLMRALMDWLGQYKQGKPDFHSIDEISEYERTHRMEEIRAMRAGGRAITLFKWRRSIAEEEKTRLEGLVSEEQAAELATA